MIICKTKLLLISLLFIVGSSNLVESSAESDKTYYYVPPCNMKHPYGDENDLCTDVTLNDTNEIVCKEKVMYMPEYDKCPFPPADPGDMKLTDPYIKCPQFPALPAPGQLPADVPVFPTISLCKNCDVKLTPDGAAVNLKCIGCQDLPTIEAPVNLTEKDLAYTVYFVEIANYTSVAVEGTQHFNP